MKYTVLILALLMVFSVFAAEEEAVSTAWTNVVTIYLTIDGVHFGSVENNNYPVDCNGPQTDMCSWYEADLGFACWMHDTTSNAYSDTFFAGDAPWGCGYNFYCIGPIVESGYDATVFQTALDAFQSVGRLANMEINEAGDRFSFRAWATVGGNTYVYALDTMFATAPAAGVDLVREMSLAPHPIWGCGVHCESGPACFWPCYPDCEPSSVEENKPIPTEFKLAQNTPNPFNSTTNIEYAVPTESMVKVEVSNILGQHVRTLVNEHQNSGYYTISWDGKDDGGAVVASGSYFYSIKAGTYEAQKRMLLIK